MEFIPVNGQKGIGLKVNFLTVHFFMESTPGQMGEHMKVNGTINTDTVWELLDIQADLLKKWDSGKKEIWYPEYLNGVIYLKANRLKLLGILYASQTIEKTATVPFWKEVNTYTKASLLITKSMI